RLGPSDGAVTAAGGGSFAPAFLEEGRWRRLADPPGRFEAAWGGGVGHPPLGRGAGGDGPQARATGPAFRSEFTLTPDGILSEVRKTSPGVEPWAVTWPLLENDGAALARSATPFIAATGYPGGTDRQNFIALDAALEMAPEAVLRGSYGDLRPIRVSMAGGQKRT